jgi:hypothetical protein
MEIEVINDDLITKSKELIQAIDPEIKIYIKKVNLALKDKETITYRFILKNDTEFEMSIKREDLQMLTVVTNMCKKLLKKLISENQFNLKNSSLDDTKKIIQQMDLEK